MSDLEHPSITQVNRTGYANVVAQPEHAGIDYFDTEILAGDEVVVDPNGGNSVEVLKTDLERYLSEVYGFEFKIAD